MNDLKEIAREAVESFREEIAYLRAQVAALKPYCQHNPDCVSVLDDESDEVLADYQTCSCGLSDVLTRIENEMK